MADRSLRPPPPAVRPIPAVNWRGVWTLYVKEVMRFSKSPAQTVLAPVVNALLFLAIFSLAIGPRMEVGGGLSFAAFLAPGLVMMTIIQNAFQNTATSLLICKVQGSIVDVLMPPLGPGELVAGFALSSVTRGLLVGAVTAIVMAFAVGMAVPAPGTAILFSLLAALAMALVGLLAGLWAEKFDHLAAVGNFVILPLSFLSGTFYTIERLPEPWADAARFNPVFHMIDGFRYGMIGWSDSDPAIGAAVLVGVNLALLWAAYRLLKSGYKLKT